MRIWPDYLFPGPAQVFDALRLGIEDRTFLYAVATSLRRFVIGFSMALVIGIGLGLAIGSLRLVRETVGPLLIGLQSLPNIAWLPMNPSGRRVSSKKGAMGVSPQRFSRAAQSSISRSRWRVSTSIPQRDSFTQCKRGPDLRIVPRPIS